jgi:hypothetical protein
MVVPTQNERRPTVVAELRAWIAVATVLLVNGIGGVWWAASLSSELKFVQQMLTELRSQVGTTYTTTEARRDREAMEQRISDHEHRLRQLEKGK